MFDMYRARAMRIPPPGTIEEMVTTAGRAWDLEQAVLRWVGPVPQALERTRAVVAWAQLFAKLQPPCTRCTAPDPATCLRWRTACAAASYCIAGVGDDYMSGIDGGSKFWRRPEVG